MNTSSGNLRLVFREFAFDYLLSLKSICLESDDCHRRVFFNQRQKHRHASHIKSVIRGAITLRARISYLDEHDAGNAHERNKEGIPTQLQVESKHNFLRSRITSGESVPWALLLCLHSIVGGEEGADR